MDPVVVAYYRDRAGAYRAVIPAFPTEEARGATLAALADAARGAVADALGVDDARVRVALVALAAYAAAAPRRRPPPAGPRRGGGGVGGGGDPGRSPDGAGGAAGAAPPPPQAEGAPHG
jgi:hypothetical protein